MRLTITFSDTEIHQLKALAEREIRGLKEQVRFMVIQSLAATETEGAQVPAVAHGQEVSREHA